MSDRAVAILLLIGLFIFALAANPVSIYNSLALVERVVTIAAGMLIILYLLRRL